MTVIETGGSTEEELRRRIAKLERINAALMSHVERVTDKHEGAYSLFQTAILLDGRVRRRTEQLTGLMHELERSHLALEAAKDEAEKANLSKTRFLAAASHDLLQPLHAARLSISTIGGMPLDPVAAGAMGRAERGLAEIEDLIRTLLDISKLDAGIVRPNLAAVPLDEVLGEIESGYRQQAEARGLRFAVRCPAGLAAKSDGKLLGRILGNLVSNAVRYTATGGVLVAARRNAGGCRIDVVDSGRGIPDAECDLVFEEFFRGQAADDGGKGLGLGLAIVRRMASTLGHELSFRSRVGRGTWFTLVLPVGHPTGPRHASRHAQGAASAEALPAAPRVLLVAPEAAREGTRSLLESWGLDVVVAPDGTAATAEPWAAVPPDLLLVDHSSQGDPAGTGRVAELRARFGRQISAIVLTDRDVEGVEQACGCSFMLKPVKPARLRSLISSLLM